MTDLMPVIFVGHGSPMNAVQKNDFTSSLKKTGSKLRRPHAVVVISAHWVTSGTKVTSSTDMHQMYDFYGFPDELYTVRYEPSGHSSLATEISGGLADVPVGLDDAWGIDHGAWSVLLHMFPKCDVPVIEISLDAGKTMDGHYELGKRLSYLRGEDVLVIGSGNIVHNLYMMDGKQFGPEPYGWATAFDAEVAHCLLNNDERQLVKGELTGFNTAHPTDEHYLPLLYVSAMRREGEDVSFFHEGFQHGSISMRSFIIG
ncbi:MAG: 4,5-DOPA dioxygenase extradiol [Spirochaetes bacterium]|jgi:4,5-DOPA dioxygenase extradiol|nr:4,5-DOPA dioxygenase extradiol [Spirochaetota bacterium]